jgi:hypothetical protein
MWYAGNKGGGSQEFAILLNWRFSSGTEPPAPLAACGLDPTEDDLDDCEGFDPCSG